MSKEQLTQITTNQFEESKKQSKRKKRHLASTHTQLLHVATKEQVQKKRKCEWTGAIKKRQGQMINGDQELIEIFSSDVLRAKKVQTN